MHRVFAIPGWVRGGRGGIFCLGRPGAHEGDAMPELPGGTAGPAEGQAPTAPVDLRAAGNPAIFPQQSPRAVPKQVRVTRLRLEGRAVVLERSEEVPAAVARHCRRMVPVAASLCGLWYVIILLTFLVL